MGFELDCGPKPGYYSSWEWKRTCKGKNSAKLGLWRVVNYSSDIFLAQFCVEKSLIYCLSNNLVPRAHVPFGQHRDTELWNNQFPETKILGLPVSRRMRGLVYIVSRDKVDVDTFHKGIQYALKKLGKSKFGFKRTAVSNFWKQKTRGLWERACWLFQSSVCWCWPKGTWALGTRFRK